MEFNALTTALNTFIDAFNAGAARLLPYALGLLGVLIVLDLAVAGGIGALSEMTAGQWVKRLLFLGGWTFLTMRFQWVAKAFVESLVAAGFIAGGRSGDDHSLLLDPSKIAGMGLGVTEPILAIFNNVSMLFAGGNTMFAVFVYGGSYVFLIGAYFAMAIVVFLAVLEYYLVLAVAGILVPFGVWAPTRFIGEKPLGCVVGAGIKLMGMALILAISGPILGRSITNVADRVRATGELTINQMLATVVVSIGLAFFTWFGPKMLGAMAGAPSLGLADVARAGATAAQAVMTVGAAATGVGGAAVAATKVATAGLGTAAKGVSYTAGAMASGARMGAALTNGDALARFVGGAGGAIRGGAGAIGQGIAGVFKSAASVSAGAPSSFARGAAAAFRKSAVAPPPPKAPVEGTWSATAGGYRTDPAPAAGQGRAAAGTRDPGHVGPSGAGGAILPPPPPRPAGARAGGGPAGSSSTPSTGATSPAGGRPEHSRPAGGAPAPAQLGTAAGPRISPVAWADQIRRWTAPTPSTSSDRPDA